MNDIVATIIGVVGMIGLLILTAWIFYNDGVDTGRKEIATGRKKMRLVEFEDGVRNWYEESELKDLSAHKIIS